VTETVLHGGDLNVVVRIGDTVRGPVGPWSPAVHALLRHFEQVGFNGAPRFLGIDDQGREILSYVEGEPAHAPVPSGDDAVFELGALLRRMHDAQTGFAPDGLPWQTAVGAPDSGEVICHHDCFWPNVIFRAASPVALIDWDLAAPGARLEDLVSAANFWAPLRPDEQSEAWGLPTERRPERLRALCDGYGLAAAERLKLVDTVELLLERSIATYHRWGRDERRSGWGEMWDRDQDRYLQARRLWFEDHREEIRSWLR
jgi:Ser/Thr protein kinase RdoA (MazF antagonist)